MITSPVFAYAASPPPHSTSKALAALRNERASVADLRSALASVAAEVSAAEANVDRLESERRRLLASSAPDGAIDQIDEALKAANRTWERISAAKDELPARLAEREALEGSLGKRAARAKELQQRGLAILVEMHPLATQLARLLNNFFDAAQEVEATSEELTRAGLPSIDWPLPELARHLGCAVDELPQISGWNLHGYFPSPALPPERQLGRAKELLQKGKK